MYHLKNFNQINMKDYRNQFKKNLKCIKFLYIKLNYYLQILKKSLFFNWK